MPVAEAESVHVVSLEVEISIKLRRGYKLAYLSDVAVIGLSGVLSELSLVNGGISTLDVEDGITGDSSVELGVVVTPVDDGNESVGKGVSSV